MCGGTGLLFRIGMIWYYAVCEDCHCSTDVYADKATAEKVWGVRCYECANVRAGLTVANISARMHVKPSTVTFYLQNGMKKIRRRLDDNPELYHYINANRKAVTA